MSFEDQRTNRLLESCNIFETIVNNATFQSISIILFLTKTDLLEEKLRQPNVDIRNYFPEFDGNPRSLKDVQEFELKLFDMRRAKRDQMLFHHFTTTTNTEGISFVLHAVRDTILGNSLSSVKIQ